MKQPEDIRLEFVREWVQRAEEDYRTTHFLHESDEDYLTATVFHAQQASEKYLKSFLVWQQVEFQKTHDIAKLLELIKGHDMGLAESLEEAVELTPFGVEYRYPGDYPNVTFSEVDRAVELAKLVRQAIRSRLPKELFED